MVTKTVSVLSAGLLSTNTGSVDSMSTLLEIISCTFQITVHVYENDHVAHTATVQIENICPSHNVKPLHGVSTILTLSTLFDPIFQYVIVKTMVDQLHTSEKSTDFVTNKSIVVCTCISIPHIFESILLITVAQYNKPDELTADV
jgi:hypothetical protein